MFIETIFKNSRGNIIKSHGSKTLTYVNRDSHIWKHTGGDAILMEYLGNIVKSVLNVIYLTWFEDRIILSIKDVHAMRQGIYLIYLRKRSFINKKQRV